MIHRPQVGRMKDNYVLWHEGMFFMFSMHSLSEPNDEPSEWFRNVWLATSPDGVHWTDIGRVISDAPFPIWAMTVYRVEHGWVLNHGSFSAPGVQNVIRHWYSTDLVTWTYMGQAHDTYPDGRWYAAESRLDCMDVIWDVIAGAPAFVGYATGLGGFLVSSDGIEWSGVRRPHIDWAPFSAPQVDYGLEIGGCQRIGDRYYLIGGWFNYLGAPGYGVYTLVGNRPLGPFSAAPMFRLCGNQQRMVAMWARYCRTPDALLVSGYMYDGHTYESGTTWLQPLKEAVVDAGSLRLRYWAGNDRLKGEQFPIDPRGASMIGNLGSDPSLDIRDDGALTIRTAEVPAPRADTSRPRPTAIALFQDLLDFTGGTIIEGTVTVSSDDPVHVAPSAGLYLEERPGLGTAVLLHGFGRTDIGVMDEADDLAVTVEDEIGGATALVAGIRPDVVHTFRLLARRNMFEMYLDELLVQTFNTTHTPNAVGMIPQRLGLVVQNGTAVYDALRVTRMA